MTNSSEMVTSSLIPNYPFTAVVEGGEHSLSGVVLAQPSKNYSTRYLLAAALADGESLVHRVAVSEDSAALQRCLTQLGAQLRFRGPLLGTPRDEVAGLTLDLSVRGFGKQPQVPPDGVLNVGNAGAVLRFLLAISALLPKVTFVTDRPESLGKRPNDELLAALEQLGCRCESQEGKLPITVYGGQPHGGQVQLSGARSSQFLSGLLFLAPLVGEPVEIRIVDRLVSKAPVMQTLEVLERCGVRVTYHPDLMEFHIDPQAYHPGEFYVNGDWPGSTALLAAAAVTNSEITVAGLSDDQQGERLAARALADMGAAVKFKSSGNGQPSVRLRGGRLRGIEFDGDLATDAVLALLGAAALAEGRSRFYNVANLRIKECDRITEPLQELRKIGVRCWEGKEVGDPDPDAIIIEGNPDGYEGGVTVDGRGDHRVIMLLTIVGLRCRKGLRIRGANHVAKSYPLFFNHLIGLGARIRLEEEGAA
ncbi:MAG: 3-phosphoshikimate 1-carboxyvinyltransferase [Candidatus Sumerlaea chitinivorans]|nr:3-phosphoshikimate 1-carboxyvinyltransferase [Candidatus Sumerlaea chitinivorans]